MSLSVRKQKILGFAVVCGTVVLIVLMQVIYMHRTPEKHRYITEYVTRHAVTTPTWPHQNFTCNTTLDVSDVEDILCMKPQEFLPNFKNPCWYEVDEYNGRRLRCLPYFHIIGSPKSGTTDVYERLLQHPQVLPNEGLFSKETWYWSWQRYGKYTYPDDWESDYMTLSEFIDFFKTDGIAEMKVNLKDNSRYSDKIIGHGDPMDYAALDTWRMIQQNDPKSEVPMYTTPHLIKHINPNIKLILLLREPVERLYSHYVFGKYGKSPDDFHSDVEVSITEIKKCEKSIGLRACLLSNSLIEMLKAPITVSMYAIYLEEWLKVFPRDQIYIMRSEDYYDDIDTNIRGVFRFLELDDISSKNMMSILKLPRQYKTIKKRKFGSMHSDTRQLLLDFFADSNKRLAEILKDDKYLWSDYKKPQKQEIRGLQLLNYERKIVGDRLVIVGRKKSKDYREDYDYYGSDDYEDKKQLNADENVLDVLKKYIKSDKISTNKKKRILQLLKEYKNNSYDKYDSGRDNEYSLYNDNKIS